MDEQAIFYSKRTDWDVISRDGWIEVFSHLTFNERNRIRVICKTWDLWIKECKLFWPTGYEIFSSIIRNIPTETHKVSKIKIGPRFTDIITKFSNGLVLFNEDKKTRTFWIYSETTFKLLYSHDEIVKSIQVSRNHIAIQNLKEELWILTFKYSSSPLESLVVCDKRRFKNSFDYVFMFPLLGFTESNTLLSLLDLRTDISLLKEKTLQFTHLWTKEDNIMIRMDLHNGFQKLIVFKPHPIKGSYETIFEELSFEFQNCWYYNSIYFFSSIDGRKSIIRWYNINSYKLSKVSINSDNVLAVDDTFVICEAGSGSFYVYKWQNDHTKLVLFESLGSPGSKISCLFCFHSSIPFNVYNANERNTKRMIIISKKTGKWLFTLPNYNEHDTIIGNNKSRIYSRFLDRNDQYHLGVIDFAC